MSFSDFHDWFFQPVNGTAPSLILSHDSSRHVKQTTRLLRYVEKSLCFRSMEVFGPLRNTDDPERIRARHVTSHPHCKERENGSRTRKRTRREGQRHR